MGEPLKNMYNPAFFQFFAKVAKEVVPKFDERKFIKDVFSKEWAMLELKQRVRHITLSLHQFFPEDYRKASPLLIALTKKFRQLDSKEQGFALIFLADYIEVYGIDYLDESVAAMGEVTKLVSAEFAVRPFLIRYYDQMMEQMLLWSQHKDASVRRFSSEGCRPRLPWAAGVPALKVNPDKIILILENLKQDPSEYVRRSVANNLNDIAKDHPEVVLKLVKKWFGKNKNTDWIIKHGCRTLLKKGHEGVLIMHGFSTNFKGAVRKLTLSTNVIKIGSAIDFSFEFLNQEKREMFFRFEYKIHYFISSGKVSEKVFQIKECNVDGGQLITIKRKQSFKDLTTRKHYKGKHTLYVMVNGKPLAKKEFLIA